MKKISSDTVEKFELTLEKLSMLFKKSLLISFQSDVIHCHYRNNIVFHWIQYRKKIFILRLKAILKKKFEEKLQGCRKRCLFNFTFDIKHGCYKSYILLMTSIWKKKLYTDTEATWYLCWSSKKCSLNNNEKPS